MKLCVSGHSFKLQIPFECVDEARHCLFKDVNFFNVMTKMRDIEVDGEENAHPVYVVVKKEEDEEEKGEDEEELFF